MTPDAAHSPGAPDLDRLAGLVAALDRALARLDHQGLIPPHQPCTGEEAVLVGAAAALGPRDWAFWGGQVCVPALLRGLSPGALVEQALYASQAASLAERRLVLCSQGPAARLPHAVGLAWAARRDSVCALVELGDGVLSDGDVHVGLNFAAVLHAPVVFVVRSDGRRPVALRGEGYAIPTTRVDGRSTIAVHEAVSAALERARRGEGPTLIEAHVDRSVPWDAALVAEHDDAVEAAVSAALRAGAARPRAIDTTRLPLIAASQIP